MTTRPVQVRLRAPAKVNLHLELLRQRPDGYHDVETVLQAIGLCDEVAVQLLERLPGGEPRISVDVVPGDAAPADRDNLCWQAARLFCRRQRVSGHLKVMLRKEIPAGAGLGGGSSDAMAVLVACDRLFGTKLDPEQLAELGAEIGSDVPFFLNGGTQLGRGKGTQLSLLPAIRRGWFVVAWPAFSLATADVYQAARLGLTVRSPVANIQVIKSLIARFPTGSWFGFNRLEEVVLPAHPELQRALLKLRESAAMAMLSGSGSAIYAVYHERADAEAMAADLAVSFPFARCVAPQPAGVQLLEG